jgi:hypothetical protein
VSPTPRTEAVVLRCQWGGPKRPGTRTTGKLLQLPAWPALFLPRVPGSAKVPTPDRRTHVGGAAVATPADLCRHPFECSPSVGRAFGFLSARASRPVIFVRGIAFLWPVARS